MAFVPSSVVYLLNTPLDKTYKNQIYFTSKDSQEDYFISCRVKSYADFTYLRKDNIIRVPAHADELYNCNYVMYRNSSYGTRWFYCFITDIKYVNDGCTELTIETDVFQTWLFDVTFMRSFVVREHVSDDSIGAHIIQEDLPTGEYKQRKIATVSNLTNWGYIVATTHNEYGEPISGDKYSGVYSAAAYYYFDNDANSIDSMNALISSIEVKNPGSIIFVAAIPDMSVGSTGEGGRVSATSSPALRNTSIVTNFSIDGYAPKNKKLFTFPYFSLYATTHDGHSNIYPLEFFSNPSVLDFDMYGDISAAPKVRLVPKNYKGVEYNYDEGLTLGGFPQCSFNVDAFNNWLSQNELSLIISGLGAAGQFAAGNYAGGAMATLGMVNQIYQASLTPNQAKGNVGTGAINLGMGINKFEFYYNMVTADYAQMIDNYFDMYGYKVNRVKVPNLNTRPYWNYVQTKDINIKGDIPNDDMVILKTAFNDGVTLWHGGGNVGNYSLDNH